MIKLDEYILENNLFSLNYAAKDINDAIKAGTDLLVKQGSVEERYYYNIISAYEDMGPYFVIAPGLAMPHARPEEGVLENCFSLVTLKKPLNSGSSDNDPVKILLTIGAIEAKSMNTEVIVQMADLFDCDEAIELIYKANSKEDLTIAFKKWREVIE